MPASPINSPVLCFGEVLWDFLPHGTFPGGAPFNVAYHLHRLAVPVRPISAVGRDDLGEQLLQRLAQWGVSTSAISRHATLPTGRVSATLSPQGDAQYVIARDVAWDRITLGPDTLKAAVTSPALVFGSLALRSAENRAVLKQLMAALPVNAWRVFDVNLRAPHDDLALVREFASSANVLKLNATEAARWVDATESPGQEESHARALAAQFKAALICITAGERGAGLLRANRWTWVSARRIAVADTVGAGDAFLAAFLCSLLRTAHTDTEMLSAACRLGEWVAAHPGATPDYDTTTPI
jgi:fructokinase